MAVREDWHRREVQRRYDNTTAVWERFSQGGTAVHRAVWGEAIASRREAFGYLDKLVAEQVTALDVEAPRLLDLGCGLGASLMNLARLLPQARGVGVTISPRQAKRAQQLVGAAGLDARVRCIEADFLELPELGVFDVGFAIEAFVHAADPSTFFASVSQRLRPGGRLIICDDFRARAPRGPKEERWLELIRRGWLASCLITVDAARALGKRHGLALVENRDLTASLELRRPRDLLISALLLVTRPFQPASTLWRSWIGGDALQRALVARLLEFRFMVFERLNQR
jgi:cyclopropane fatty-acyl-phospholipid synthase-like methyltransferase